MLTSCHLHGAVSVHSECGNILYVLFCLVLNRHLIRQWTIAKVLTPRTITYQIKLFCLPKKHVFNFTGNSEESKLGSYFTNRKHHMADDCAFVCVSKPWFHSSTGKAHLSLVLKKTDLSERTF